MRIGVYALSRADDDEGPEDYTHIEQAVFDTESMEWEEGSAARVVRNVRTRMENTDRSLAEMDDPEEIGYAIGEVYNPPGSITYPVDDVPGEVVERESGTSLEDEGLKPNEHDAAEK